MLAAGALGAASASAAPGDIVTAAGTGEPAYGGDGKQATLAKLNGPWGLAPLPGGGFLVADIFNNRIRRVGARGVITTVAGDGQPGVLGDGGPARSAELQHPNGVALLPGGGFLVADTDNHLIRKVGPGGKISTVVGDGQPGYGGDNGPAADAKLQYPNGIAALANGGYLIADTYNQRVREVVNGTIFTVAGDGVPGFGGDNGPATEAELSYPSNVAPLRGGGFLIADRNNHRIRRVSPGGTIMTVAGTGTPGFGGDGGQATDAELQYPYGVAALPGGAFLIADTYNKRVRRVSATGRITTVAGDGTTAHTGEGGPARKTSVFAPYGVAPVSDGGFLISDFGDDRVRRVEGFPPKTTITQHPKSTVTTHKKHVTLTFAFQTGQPGATFACKLDDGAYSPCKSPKSYSVGTGRHTFKVRAMNVWRERGLAASFDVKVVHQS